MHVNTGQGVSEADEQGCAPQSVANSSCREREFILARIREYEAQIASRARQIQLLRMELNKTSARGPDQDELLWGQGA